jgi:SHS2 domain-containing protein
MAFWFEEHTADVTLVASGESFAEALSEAAVGLSAVMTDEQVAAKHAYPVRLVAESREALLFDFLAHMVFLLDTEALFVARADLVVREEAGEWVLSGEVVGDVASNYEHSGDVKAPTYNRLEVVDEEGGCLVRATLDL